MTATSRQADPTFAEDEPHEEPEPTPAELDDHLMQLGLNYSRASSNCHGPVAASPKPSSLAGRVKYNVEAFWRHQISIKVDHDTCRDHLALERTFLAYLRTSFAFSMIGISTAYLFRIQHAPNPSAALGFYRLGKPLSYILQAVAIITLIVGAFRTWRSQNAIVRGKAISGGFEIVLIALITFLTLMGIFALLVAIDVMKEDL